MISSVLYWRYLVSSIHVLINAALLHLTELVLSVSQFLHLTLHFEFYFTQLLLFTLQLFLPKTMGFGSEVGWTEIRAWFTENGS